MMIAARRGMLARARGDVAEPVERRRDAADVAAREGGLGDLFEQRAGRAAKLPSALAAFAMLLRARSTAVELPSCCHSDTVSPKSAVARQ